MEIRDQADALAEYMSAQLRVKGDGLEAVTARAGRLLPRHLKGEVQKIVDASNMSAHPRLERMIDDMAVKRADRKVRTFLDRQNPGKARRAAILDRVAGVAFVVVTVVLIVFFVLLSRGFFN